MDILIAAGEAVPYYKTGGLADVVGALFQRLNRMGHRACLFLPAYRAAEAGKTLKPVPGQYWVPVGDVTVPVSLSMDPASGSAVYFVHHSRYFSRDGLYGEGGKDYEDNDARFIFFSRAVLEGAKFIDFRPDVIHVHDWQAGLIPAYLKTLYRMDAFFARTRSVLTIHNIAYQGMFNKNALFLAGFGWSDYTPDRLEYYGGFNFLKAGLAFADVLNTVSPSYAQEIRSSEEFGRGMEGLLRYRSEDLFGILNGIDVEVWNPQTDRFLAKKYGPKTAAAGKAANKQALLSECDLSASDGAPLVGVVSRLDPQKGLDVVLSLVPSIVERGAALMVLGTGDPELQKGFEEAAEKHPRSVHFHSQFDDPFAHRLYAGSDIFLMPSRFEPCGLGQMIAMRYGAVPVVTRTGGLADTVRENAAPGAGSDAGPFPNGFVAPRCAEEEVMAAVGRAFAAFERPAPWDALRANAMARDSSWTRSAEAYVDLYRRAAAKEGESA